MLHSYRRSRTTMVAIAIANTLGATGAGAAEPATNTGALEEIIVTAQKRDENLQDTPIAITALSAADIEERGITSPRDLIGAMPGVTGYESPSTRGALSINLRGVGSGNPGSLSNDPSNAVYVDGVLYAKGVGLGLDQSDLERIEVLRGPQGTLYGRNTTGGAVNFITRKPSGEWGAKFTVGAGNYGSRDYRAFVDLPTFANIATTFSASKRERDPLYESTSPDVPGFENVDRQGFRFAARWTPSDSFTIDYVYDRNELDELGQGLQVIGLNPTGAAIATSSGFPTNVLPISTSRSATLTAIQNNLQFLGPAAQTPQVQQLSQWITDYRAWEASMYASDVTDVRAADTIERTTSEAYGHSLVMAWNVDDLGPFGNVEFKSITGFRKIDAMNSGDLDAQDNSVRPLGNGLTTGLVPDLVLQTIGGLFFNAVSPALPGQTEFAIAQAMVDTINARGSSASFLNYANAEYEQLQQELQMVGTSGNLDYAVGLFYFEDEGQYRNNRWSLFPIAYSDTTSHDLESEAWAVYTQGTWSPSDTSPLSLTAGLRYTEETKGVTYLWRSSANPAGFVGAYFAGNLASPYVPDELAETQAPVAGVFGQKFEEDFDNLSGKFTLGWRVTDNVNAYATYSTGYKSGGYNGDSFDVDNGTSDALQPEEITNYELGLKSTLLDGRMRLNLAAFRYDYEDMQIATLLARPNGSVVSRIQNAGEAIRTGGELELAIMPFDNLTLSLTYAYIDGDFETYPNVSAGNGTVIADTKQYAIRPQSPDNQASANLDWTILRGGFGALALNVNANWMKESPATALASDAYDTNGDRVTDAPVIFFQPPVEERTVLNARLSLRDMQVGGASLRVSAWGKNLTDEVFREFGFNYGGSLGLNVAQYGEPRTYGVDLTLEF